MKVKVGDYLIDSDSSQFILKQIKVVQKSDNQENIGKPYEAVLGYYPSIDSVLRAIPNRVLLDNDDLKEISRKLSVLSIKIGAIRMALERVVEK